MYWQKSEADLEISILDGSPCDLGLFEREYCRIVKLTMDDKATKETAVIAFRADGNSTIGMGHLMRCLSIADAARDAAMACIFIASDSRCRELIQSRGYEFVSLDGSYDALNKETVRLFDILKNRSVSVLLVDTYFAGQDYISTVWRFMKQHGGILACMDGDQEYLLPCDILINYNIYGPQKRGQLLQKYHTLPPPTFLLGSAYAPLRREFVGLPDRETQRNAKRILISTGGADPEHLTAAFLNVIQERYAQYSFHVVVGMMNPDKETIESIAKKTDSVHLYYNVQNMCALMRSCDVAVSAAGSTLYELCATQTPTVTYVLAENQLQGALEFSRQRIMLYAGDIRESGKRKLAEAILEMAVSLIGDLEKSALISQKLQGIVDGYGGDRIIGVIKSKLAENRKST